MAEREDRLHAEVDRQLEEIREQATALATRAGLVLGVVAIGSALLAARIDQVQASQLTKVYWALALAAIFGIVALVPNLHVGPGSVDLGDWMTSVNPTQPVVDLYRAKRVLLEANRSRLPVMTVAFYMESVAVVVAVILALVTSAGR